MNNRLWHSGKLLLGLSTTGELTECACHVIGVDACQACQQHSNQHTLAAVTAKVHTKFTLQKTHSGCPHQHPSILLPHTSLRKMDTHLTAGKCLNHRLVTAALYVQGRHTELL